MTNKILIGDDKADVKANLTNALNSRNLEVDLASTPLEIIAKAKSNKYFAIITDLDYTKEGREGYDVLKAIKDLPTIKILYTGESGFEFVPEAFENGADYAVLRKNQTQLLDILDKELKGGK